MERTGAVFVALRCGGSGVGVAVKSCGTLSRLVWLAICEGRAKNKSSQLVGCEYLRLRNVRKGSNDVLSSKRDARGKIGEGVAF